ncbi:OLC1v1007941C1 [Oldenlandia corymbosa var. corymbosa]|uniref:OLC1v1007941C1 n=1 Tax=Oldenlandia corymbosa var. corymbosa TaxID=529605 RepID=A0AAV1DKV0_OLDCO|nr:OLC1v1007941C1 [Oldenlandia corymbosa var. corymbosa]
MVSHHQKQQPKQQSQTLDKAHQSATQSVETDNQHPLQTVAPDNVVMLNDHRATAIVVAAPIEEGKSSHQQHPTKAIAAAASSIAAPTEASSRGPSQQQESQPSNHHSKNQKQGNQSNPTPSDVVKLPSLLVAATGNQVPSGIAAGDLIHSSVAQPPPKLQATPVAQPEGLQSCTISMD